MILAIDVHYRQSTALAAGVLFEHWSDSEPNQEYTCEIQNVAPYASGNFYKRELPCILALLNKHNLLVDCIVIDGYVYLGDESQPGLGKYLFDALGGLVTVVGVAKSPFPGISNNQKVFRGKSEKPLFVTTTGDLAGAKNNIKHMHGKFRLPTLLKRADYLCRGK